MTDRARLGSIVAFAAAAFGCVPDIEDDTSRIEGPRVLALRSEPAESAEGGQVTVTALAATPDGAPRDVDFVLCTDRKPLTELGPVSPRCIESRDGEPDVLTPLGTGELATLTVPAEACTLFGPERPDPKPGEPSPRPVDPDLTGGFYQPVIAWLGGDATLGAVRLACPLSGAPRDATVDFNRRYRPNANPSVLALERVRGDGSGQVLSARGAPLRVAPGERLRLRAVVPPCPFEPVCGDGICGALEDRVTCREDCDEPKGCGGAERYAIYDPSARAVRDATESLVASWYATSGELREERTDPIDPEVMENDWTAPLQPGSVRLWVVVRDDRGGSDWRSGIVEVTE